MAEINRRDKFIERGPTSGLEARAPEHLRIFSAGDAAWPRNVGQRMAASANSSGLCLRKIDSIVAGQLTVQLLLGRFDIWLHGRKLQFQFIEPSRFVSGEIALGMLRGVEDIPHVVSEPRGLLAQSFDVVFHEIPPCVDFLLE